MTDTDAIRAMREQVEAGEWPLTAPAPRTPLAQHWSELCRSYNGSLDAARSIHEALLPGWAVYNFGWWPALPDRLEHAKANVTLWATHEDEQGERWHGSSDAKAEGSDNDPARAWLIAILHALEAQGGEG